MFLHFQVYIKKGPRIIHVSHHPLALAPLPQVNTLIVCVFLAETWWQRAEYPTWAGAWLMVGGGVTMTRSRKQEMGTWNPKQLRIA